MAGRRQGSEAIMSSHGRKSPFHSPMEKSVGIGTKMARELAEALVKAADATDAESDPRCGASIQLGSSSDGSRIVLWIVKERR